MKKGRIWIIILCGMVVSSMMVSNGNGAEKFPSRPINLYIGMPAGGGLHTMSRVIADKATEILGVPVLVISKPGAGGTIAAEFVNRSKPDGYTLCVPIPQMVSYGEYLLSEVKYKNTDFEYFGMFGTNYMFLYVMSEKPWKTLEELIAYAKKNPNGLKYPSISISMNILMENFCKSAGIKMIHVPMKGETENMAAMVGGHVDVGIGFMRTLQSMTEAGKIRILAAFTDERKKYFPNVPTFAEKGFPQATDPVVNFYGVAGPKGMPKEVSAKLNDAFAKTFQDKGVHESLEKIGVDGIYMPPAEFEKLISSSEKNFRKLYKEYGFEILNK
jgi:tripartite-type tricarboxylate transporter receptor subunit TctC